MQQNVTHKRDQKLRDQLQTHTHIHIQAHMHIHMEMLFFLQRPMHVLVLSYYKLY